MAGEYARSDVVLKLSRVEGMFGPPLEGFHRGATCVVTPVTGHDEYVEHGWNGARRRLGRRARHRARARPARARPRAAAPAAHATRWPPRARGRRGASRPRMMALALRRIRREPSPDPTGSAARLAADARVGMEVHAAPDARLRAAAHARRAGSRTRSPRGPVLRTARKVVRRVLVGGRGLMGLGIRTRLRRAARRRARRRRVPRGARGRPSCCASRAAALVARATPTGRSIVAIVVPFFRQGSGGHTTIANLVRGLERRGHRCSLWIDDPGRRCAGGPTGAERDLRAWFGPFAADVHYGFDAWQGADVVVATGWQTVARVRVAARRAAARTSSRTTSPSSSGPRAQRALGRGPYRHGLYPITAGPVAGRRHARASYGLPATHFELGVDHERLPAAPTVARRDDVVLFYARASTPRRAVPLGSLALGELKRRRPQTRDRGCSAHGWPPRSTSRFRNLGVVERRRARAAVRRGDGRRSCCR